MRVNVLSKFNCFIPSKDAVQWIYENTKCFKSLDFQGYAIDLAPYPFYLLIDLESTFYLVQLGSYKKVSKRKIKKTINKLLKINFLKCREIIPFEEFEYYKNIPLNTNNLITIKEHFRLP